MADPLFLNLPYALERGPPPFEPGNDIKCPESLVRYFLEKFTLPGNRIFDPFAGLGTTLFVAEEMGRIPYGMEADPDRHAWVAGQLEHWMHLRHGDAATMGKIGFPGMDFSMTSPPYMAKNHKWNPLFSGNPAHARYDKYLKRIGHIYGRLKTIMKRKATIIVQADNLPGRIYTPLARDLSIAVEKHFRLDAEIIVVWDGGKPDSRHTHCFVFKNVL